MQDEVNEKTVSLCIRCGKVTANLLKAAMVKALAKMEQEKKQQGQKQPQKEKEDKTYKGKQSLRDNTADAQQIRKGFFHYQS